MRIEIRWRKSTDQDHPRRRVVEIDTPVERETTALEDAVLALPGSHRGDVWVQSESGHATACTACMTPQIEAALDDPPTDEQCIDAIEDALRRAQIQVAELDADDEKAQLTREKEVIARACQYVAGERSGYQQSWRPCPEQITELGEPELADQVTVEIERRRQAEENRQTEQRRRDDAKGAQEEVESQEQMEEQLAWIEEHGSERLQRQIEAGLDGWPLYLHERLATDLPGWELDNDGEDGDVLVNPSESAVLEKLAAARHLVELELAADQKAALGSLTIRTIRFPSDDDSYSLESGYDTRIDIYLVCDCYRPGRHLSWPVKRVRIAVEP